MTDIYFDNSATTKQLGEVTAVMKKTAEAYYGNPSSLHSLGYAAEQELRRCRKVIADILNVDEKEIYFTSGGSESNNWALSGYLSANPRKGNRLLISETEHPSVLECAKHFSKCGYYVDFIPVDKRGIPDIDIIYGKVDENTAMVSVMHVNSETGALLPLVDICDAVKKKNINTVFHTDAVQSFCKISNDIKKTGFDFLSLSGHKIGGPRGIGALYIKKETKVSPLIYGGGQENGMRSGTENLPAIAGLAFAARKTYDGINENLIKVKWIRDYLVREISRDGNAVIVTDIEVSSPYILNISFPGIRSEVLLHSLESRGVYVSVGSACSSNKKSRSHVLKAMGYSNAIIDGAVRLSFSPYNTLSEAETAMYIIREETEKLYKTGQVKY